MTAKVLSTVALLGLTNASSADEWKDNDVGRVIAGMLDDPDLFEFSQSCKSFNLLARGLLAWKIKGADYKPGDVWPGKFIRFPIEANAKAIRKLGCSDESAMIKWYDYSLKNNQEQSACVHLRGVPKHADPGYTGRFATKLRIENVELLKDQFKSLRNQWITCRIIRKDNQNNNNAMNEHSELVAIKLDENLEKEKEMVLLRDEPGLWSIRGDYAGQIEFENNDINGNGLLKLAKFDEKTGIGSVIHTITISKRVVACLTDVSDDGEIPRIIYAFKKLDFDPKTNKLRVRHGFTPFNKKRGTDQFVDVSRYEFDVKHTSNVISQDGRHIATFDTRRPRFVIIDIDENKVKYQVELPSPMMMTEEEDNSDEETTNIPSFIFHVSLKQRYALVSMIKSVVPSDPTLASLIRFFFDLQTGQFVGNGFTRPLHNDPIIREHWLNQELLVSYPLGRENEAFMRSIHQPQKKVPLDRDYRFQSVQNTVVEQINEQRKDLLIGVWETSHSY